METEDVLGIYSLMLEAHKLMHIVFTGEQQVRVTFFILLYICYMTYNNTIYNETVRGHTLYVFQALWSLVEPLELYNICRRR